MTWAEYQLTKLGFFSPEMDKTAGPVWTALKYGIPAASMLYTGRHLLQGFQQWDMERKLRKLQKLQMELAMAQQRQRMGH